MENKETNETEDTKLSPYDRLQSIFAEKDAGKLTETGNEKLDYLLGTKPSVFKTAYDKVVNFFKKIDSKIFAERGRTSNGTFTRRKRQNGRWT